MSTFIPTPTIAVRPTLYRGRLRGLILAAALVLLAYGSTPAHVSANSVPGIFGTCTFGPTSGTAPLTMSLTASTIDISGYGSCVDNAFTHTIALTLTGYGTFTCAGGAGSQSGTATWNPSPPSAQTTLFARTVTGPNSVSLAITSDSFTGVAELAWADPTATAACVSTGSVSVQLVGTLTYATS